MRRTAEDTEITRQNLLEAALIVFSRQGYSDTRLEDIAHEAGVTRGAIYHHFGSKAKLFNLLVGNAYRRIMPIFAEAAQSVEKGTSPLQALRRLFVLELSQMEEDAEYCAVTELVMFKTALTPELKDGMREKRTGIRKRVDFLAGLVQRAIDKGEVRADAAPRDIAISLMSLQTGLVSHWLIDKKLFSIKAQAGLAIDSFIQGIAAKAK